MNVETSLLGALASSREVYTKLKDILDVDDFSDANGLVMKEIKEYYECDKEATYVDASILSYSLAESYPKHEQMFTGIISQFKEISAPNVASLWVKLKRKSAGSKLCQAIMSGEGEDEAFQSYQKYRDETETSDGLEDLVHVGRPVSDILKSFDRGSLVTLAPDALNDRVDGGVPKGTHVLIYAPPEVGKSLFCINLACHFLETGKKVLYVGNEDAGDMMLLRVLNRLSGMTKHQVYDNPRQAEKVALDNGYNNLAFASLTPGSLRDVRKLIRRYSPDVVVVDQLPNMLSPVQDKILKLEWLASEFRNIVKEYELVGVSVVQASGNAQGKAKLDLGDVHYSNVGIQAAVDVMIGIGATDDMLIANQRLLSLTKNKVSGNHQPVACLVDPFTTRVMDVEVNN